MVFIIEKSMSLSPNTIKIVKATAPVMAEHGYAITRAMYKKMFAENPDVKSMFNQSHQVEFPNEPGARQPSVLAHAVYGYAANIDNLGALATIVERVAQKHVSVHVLPEHYPIVGQNLLWAVKDVLGDAATPEIMDAWEEAYGFLAKVFIDRETAVRESKRDEVGGWEGWRQFKVTKKEKESEEITSFYLSPVDGKPVLSYLPGQYTSLFIKDPASGEMTTRNYTLSSAPDHEDYRITVKREGPITPSGPDGVVSNLLHDKVKVGDELSLGVPCGDFTLSLPIEHQKPIVLLSGGVGLTPVVSMLEYLADHQVPNKVVVLVASRSPKVEAMYKHIESYRKRNINIVVKNIYDDLSEDNGAGIQGPLSMELVDQALSEKDAHYYFCGPTGFMKTIYTGLKEWKIPDEQMHYEFFGSHTGLE